jgi:hypothetical protein
MHDSTMYPASPLRFAVRCGLSSLGVVWLAVIAAGCTSPVVRLSSPPASASGPTGNLGHVVRVNNDLKYVVVDSPHLPSAGIEARVYRDDTIVGTIRFDGLRDEAYGSADIESGRIRVGDRVLR